MNLFERNVRADEMWNITGDFGKLSGGISHDKDILSAYNGVITVRSTVEKAKNGVYIQKSGVKNISDRTVTLYTLASKFLLNGGEYEVYTQYNGWVTESSGGWQPLVTAVTARSESIRNAHSATPFMAVWNQQTGRGIAFHLLAYSAWEMRISRVYTGGEAANVEIELGVLSDGLRLDLAPAEQIQLPEIICYEFFNKTDMDCWRLHSYLNTAYPRKAMPVIYNTWLYRFDHFTFEDIQQQIRRASALGAEYFVIDAGWFGDGRDWGATRGDWVESLTYGFGGRMAEIADAVRKSGMQFGFWIEAEGASPTANAVKTHPDWFIITSDYAFLDFANPQAASYLFDTVCGLVEKYGASFIKFDFNADLLFDDRGSAFMRYFEGYVQLIEKLRAKYPMLYMENCASGGMRMSIRDGKLFDSFWLSDNQNPYDSLRIFKDSLLRLPPQWIECWATVTALENFRPVYGSDEGRDKILATADATWDTVTGVRQSFLHGLLTGSPIGLSCDLTALTDGVFAELQTFIAQFKKKRAFWQKAVCHILTDTKTVLVLEFRDEAFSQVELVIFAKRTVQHTICVYPVVESDAVYRLSDGTERTAQMLLERGIDFPVNGRFSANFMTMEKV